MELYPLKGNGVPYLTVPLHRPCVVRWASVGGFAGHCGCRICVGWPLIDSNAFVSPYTVISFCTGQGELPPPRVQRLNNALLGAMMPGIHESAFTALAPGGDLSAGPSQAQVLLNGSSHSRRT